MLAPWRAATSSVPARTRFILIAMTFLLLSNRGPTAVIPGQPPEITYSNPRYRGDPSPGAFLRRDPIGYVATLGVHLFAMFDPDFLFTYVTDLHPDPNTFEPWLRAFRPSG